MIYKLKGSSTIEVEVTGNANDAKLINSGVQLEVSKEVKKMFFDAYTGKLKKEGYIGLDQSFLRGLLSSIKGASDNGIWNKEKHIEFIFSQFQEAINNLK